MCRLGDLIVGQPSSPISVFEIDRLGLEAQVLENIENCIKLRSFDMLQDHFSSPIQNHIHILVQLRRCEYLIFLLRVTVFHFPAAKLPTPTVHPSEGWFLNILVATIRIPYQFHTRHRNTSIPPPLREILEQR